MSNAIFLRQKLGAVGSTCVYAGGFADDMFTDGKWTAYFDGSLAIDVPTLDPAEMVATCVGAATVANGAGHVLVDVNDTFSGGGGGGVIDDTRAELVYRLYGDLIPALYLGGIDGFTRARVVAYNMYERWASETVYVIMSDRGMPRTTIVTQTAPPKPVCTQLLGDVSLGFGASVFAMSNYFSAVKGTAPLTFKVDENPLSNARLLNNDSLAVTARYRNTSYNVSITATNMFKKHVTQVLSVSETDAPPPTQLRPLGSVSLGAFPKTYSLSNYFSAAVGTTPLSYAICANPLSNATLSDSSLTLTGDYRGTSYDVQVSATNSFDKMLVQSLSVTEPAPPSPVVLETLGNITLTTGIATYDLSDFFTTAADTLPLTFALLDNPQANASLGTDAILVVSGAYRGLTYAVTVSATNSFHKTLVQQLNVTEPEPPSPIVSDSLGDITLTTGVTTYDLSDFFTTAADTLPLTFALLDNPQANASLGTDAILVVSGAYRGLTYAVTVSATNSFDKTLVQQLNVTEPEPPSPIASDSLGDITLTTGVTTYDLSDFFTTAADTLPLTFALLENPQANAFIGTDAILVVSGAYRGLTYGVTVAATNSFGKMLVQQLNVTEPEPPSPIASDSLGDITLLGGLATYDLSDFFTTAADTLPLTFALLDNPHANAYLGTDAILVVSGAYRGLTYGVTVSATNSFNKTLVQQLNIIEPEPPSPIALESLGSVTLTTQTVAYPMSASFSTPTGSWPLTYEITTNPQSNAYVMADVLHISGAYREAAYGVWVTARNAFNKTLTQELHVVEPAAPPPTLVGLLGAAYLSDDVGVFGLSDYFTTTVDTRPLHFYVLSNPMSNVTLTGDILTVVPAYRATLYEVAVSASNAFGKIATQALSVTEALSLRPFSAPPPPCYTGLADVVFGPPVPTYEAVDTSTLTWTLAPPVLAGFVDAASGVVRVPRGTPAIATTEVTLTATGPLGVSASVSFPLATELWAAPVLAPVESSIVTCDTKTSEFELVATQQVSLNAGPMTWHVAPYDVLSMFLDANTGTFVFPVHTYVPPSTDLTLTAVGLTGLSASVSFRLSVIPWATPVVAPPNGVPAVCYTGRGAVQLPPPAQTAANAGSLTWSVSPDSLPGVSVDAASGVLTLSQNATVSPSVEFILTATGPTPTSYAASTPRFSVTAVIWAAPVLANILDQTADTMSAAFSMPAPAVTSDLLGGDVGTISWTVSSTMSSSSIVIDKGTGVLTVAAHKSVSPGTQVTITATGPAPTYLVSSRIFALSVDGTDMQAFMGAPPALQGNNTVVPCVFDAATLLLTTTDNLPPLTWSLETPAPASVTIDTATGMITVPASTAVSNSTLTVQVSSRRGVVSGSVAIRITTYDAPTLVATPPTLSGDNTTTSLTFDATSFLVTTANLGPLTWTLGASAPNGVTIAASTGIITAAAGFAVPSSSTFPVTVTGQRGAASRNLVMGLVTYDAPTFLATAVAQPLTGNNSVIAVTIDASAMLTTKNNIGPGLVWSLSPVPAGVAVPSVTINASTGIITAQPEIAVSGQGFVLQVAGRRGTAVANVTMSLTTIPPSTTVIKLDAVSTTVGNAPKLADIVAKLQTWANNQRYMSLYASTDGYQLIKIPVTATCTITVAGAHGGSILNGLQGGKGAVFTVKVALQQGDALLVIVGQAGVSNGQVGTNYLGGGGGGGSFVALVPSGSSTWTKLLVAAGGGGGFNSGGSGNYNGGDAATTYVDENTNSAAGIPTTLNASGNGAGWLQDGITAKCVTNKFTSGGSGGFGGGGEVAEFGGGGGGGGYIGGSAGGRYASTTSAAIMKGGGNFVHSSVTLISNIVLGTHDNGYVNLSYRTATINEAVPTMGSVVLGTTSPYPLDLYPFFTSHAPIMYYLTSNPQNNAVLSSSNLTLTGALWGNNYSVVVSASNASTPSQPVGISTLNITESLPSRPTATSMGAVTLTITPLSLNVSSYFVDPQASPLTYYLSANPQSNATLTGTGTSTVLAATGSGRGVTYNISVSASNTYNLGSISSVAVTEPSGSLYTFTSFIFNQVNTVANTGPLLSFYQSKYSSQPFYTSGYFSLYKNYNGYQVIRVPQTGSYMITAVGASGGSASTRSGVGGAGGKIKGTFTLTYGQRIIILVGQGGGMGAADQCGGGGGTFVVSWGDNNVLTPLAVAGGGGAAVKNANGSAASGVLITLVTDNGNGINIGAGRGYANFDSNGLNGGGTTGIVGGFGGGGLVTSKGSGGGGFKGGDASLTNVEGGYGGWSYIDSNASGVAYTANANPAPGGAAGVSGSVEIKLL